jgi:hypothetical protein
MHRGGGFCETPPPPVSSTLMIVQEVLKTITFCVQHIYLTIDVLDLFMNPLL